MRIYKDYIMINGLK